MSSFLKISLLFFYSLATFAHESRPLYIQVKQVATNVIKVEYSVPNTVDFENLPNLQLATIFQKDNTKHNIKTNAQSYIISSYYFGEIRKLKQQKIELKFPFYNPTLSSVIQIYYDKNIPETHVLSPTNNVLDLRNVSKAGIQSQEFIYLGIEHIWKGFDHLLFVICLLIIAGFGKKLLWTVTGFTLAHSITLFLSVLGFVKVPVPFVEVCIALSIIFLCGEILRHFKGDSSLTYRFPVIVSTAFGLLHGLGFAAVLLEIGLPKGNLITSLLFFNIGVEIGQILFILGLFALLFGIKYIFKFDKFFNSQTLKIVTYTMGILAAFWFFERLSTW